MMDSLSHADFAWLSALVKARSGLVLGFDKLYLLETRLAPLLRQNDLRDLAALVRQVRKPGTDALAEAVVQAMTTNESFFFRDEKPFTHVRMHALPPLLARGAPVRIWSAAAASGQEAYSLAITLAELGAASGSADLLATDIARTQLDRAREGLFTQFEIQRGLPMQMLVKYFRKESEGWRIAPKLRRQVQFREWNLLGDLRPLGTFDIVFCRNVLIYFDQPTKARVLDAICRQLRPGGLLYLGGAETVLGLSERFVPLPGERGIYGLAPAAPALARVPAIPGFAIA